MWGGSGKIPKNDLKLSEQKAKALAVSDISILVIMRKTETSVTLYVYEWIETQEYPRSQGTFLRAACISYIHIWLLKKDYQWKGIIETL